MRLPMSPKLWRDFCAILDAFETCEVVVRKHQGKVQRIVVQQATITDEGAPVMIERRYPEEPCCIGT